jgi:hypothetical protein
MGFWLSDGSGANATRGLITRTLWWRDVEGPMLDFVNGPLSQPDQMRHEVAKQNRKLAPKAKGNGQKTKMPTPLEVVEVVIGTTANATGNRSGRPTKYDPSMCEVIVALSRSCRSASVTGPSSSVVASDGVHPNDPKADDCDVNEAVHGRLSLIGFFVNVAD